MRIKQRGAVLIVVLMLLVSMLMMGLALMRSTDVAGLIAGNVAIKQAATQGGDIGLVGAETALATFFLNAGTNAAGYSSTVLDEDTYGIPTNLPTGVSWAPATPVSIGSNGLAYQYLVERMCNDAAGTNCSTIGGDSGSTANCSARVDAGNCATAATPATLYRATVRITGPKNLETYVQALYSH